jgi:dual-specificity kinase
MADIWSVGCIAVELLTGDLLFPTHSDEQHLRMMLKNSGPFPHWMQAKTQNAELRQLLQPAQPELPGVAETKTAHELIPHPALRDLVRHCLHLDPTRRLNAAAALRHPFFKEKLT